MKLKTTLVLALSSLGYFAQNVGINSTGAAPDASAALDVVSTDKGILVPRMTLAQKAAIASPATGLMVYQTDGTPGFYYFDGLVWSSMIGKNGIYDGDGTTPAGTDVTVTDNINFDANTLVVDGTNNRIGIGTPTPTEKVEISNGNLLFNGTWAPGSAYSIKGINTDKQITFDYNDGTIINDNNAIIFEVGGSERVRMEDNGNVGIGTTTPSEKLHVSGNARVTSLGGSGNALVITDNNGVLSSTALSGNGTDVLDGTGTFVPLSSLSDADWTISGTNQYSAVTGNIGIGIAAPVGKLHVIGTSQNTLIVESPAYPEITHRVSGTIKSYNAIVTSAGGYFTGSAVNDWIFRNEGGASIKFGRGGTTDMTIFNNGNVGIGTTAPARLLEISSNSAPGIRINDGNALGNSFIELITVDGGASYFQNFDGRTRIFVGGAERMSFLNNGNVGIGTSTPGQKLDVVGNTELNGRFQLIDGTQGAGKVLTSDALGRTTWADIPTDGATRPAFSVSANTSIPVATAGQIARYAVTTLNQGGSMNLGSGLFTAPVSGLYHFTYTGITQSGAGVTSITFFLNGAPLGPRSYFQGNGFFPVNLAGTFHLNAGQTVGVYVYSGGLHNNAASLFSGHLIAKD